MLSTTHNAGQTQSLVNGNLQFLWYLIISNYVTVAGRRTLRVDDPVVWLPRTVQGDNRLRTLDSSTGPLGRTRTDTDEKAY